MPRFRMRFCRERFLEPPAVRDRVADEDHAPRVSWTGHQIFVGLVVAAELIPVLQLLGEGHRARQQAAVGRPRRRELIGELGVGEGRHDEGAGEGEHHETMGHGVLLEKSEQYGLPAPPEGTGRTPRFAAASYAKARHDNR